MHPKLDDHKRSVALAGHKTHYKTKSMISLTSLL